MTDDDRPRSDDAGEKPGGGGPPAGKPEEGEIKDEKPSEPEPDGAPTPKAGTPSAPGPGEKADEKEDAKKDDKKEGKGAAARVPEHEIASPTAIEKLKERVARAEKDKKPKTVRRRRISDEDRKALWHKAVLKKARKLKIMTDLLIFLLVATVLGAHAPPFIGEIATVPSWKPQAGYEIVMNLVLHGTYPHVRRVQQEAPAPPRYDGSLSVTMPKQKTEFNPTEKADVLTYGILVIPVGAALLVLLFLLDYFIWFGRLLPGFSVLWSFGSVGYLMYVRLARGAPWEMLGYDAPLAWYLLLVPLFLIGIVSVLRFVVSHRWKRYEFAGLPVPEHLKPKPPEEPAKAEEKVEKIDKPDDADKADKADEPAKAEESKEPSASSEGGEADKPKEDEGKSGEKAEDADKPGEGG